MNLKSVEVSENPQKIWTPIFPYFSALEEYYADIIISNIEVIIISLILLVIIILLQYKILLVILEEYSTHALRPSRGHLLRFSCSLSSLMTVLVLKLFCRTVSRCSVSMSRDSPEGDFSILKIYKNICRDLLQQVQRLT